MSSPTQSQTKNEKSGVQLVRDADFLIGNFLPPGESPPPYPPTGLTQPLCLPQITSGYDSPFARGYNESLATTVDLSQAQLLAFIDGLNLAITASPPLRVVDMAGMILGFVPYHWALIAGIVLQTTAQTAMHVLSKTLTDRYLRAANLRLFQPRGLSVRLCTTAAMQHLVAGAEAQTTSKGKKALYKAGRVAGGVLLKLPLPLTSRIVRAIADRPPKVEASSRSATNTVLNRRLALVEGQALPLNLEVPPPEKAKGVMDTMSSWGVKFSQFMEGRTEKKAEERRRALAASGSHRDGGGSRIEMTGAGGSSSGMNVGMYQGGMERRRVGRAERRAARRERKGRLSGGLVSGLIGPKETRLERRVANADLQEHWKTEQLLWIVVMTAEIDADIKGIEIAESHDDEERVDERAWEEELALEREEEESEESEEEELGSKAAKEKTEGGYQWN